MIIDFGAFVSAAEGMSAGQRLYLRDNGEISAKSQFSFLHIFKRGAETRNTLMKFMESIQNSPEYPNALSDAYKFLDSRHHGSLKLTAGDVLKMKEFLDRRNGELAAGERHA